MELVLAVLTGGLVAGGVYLMLRRNLVRLLFGLVLISNAINLLIFASGGLTRGRPPLLPVAPEVAQEVTANPLPQALILTAIVIGFGLLTFALVLVHRTYREFGTLDPEAIRETEPEISPADLKVVPDDKEAA
jgi:multicomponent Na+:H+ antiporter subunit C